MCVFNEYFWSNGDNHPVCLYNAIQTHRWPAGPCLYCVRTHIKYLNQADQIFRSLFSNVNKHPNISNENKENKENSDLKL